LKQWDLIKKGLEEGLDAVIGTDAVLKPKKKKRKKKKSISETEMQGLVNEYINPPNRTFSADESLVLDREAFNRAVGILSNNENSHMVNVNQAGRDLRNRMEELSREANEISDALDSLSDVSSNLETPEEMEARSTVASLTGAHRRHAEAISDVGTRTNPRVFSPAESIGVWPNGEFPREDNVVLAILISQFDEGGEIIRQPYTENIESNGGDEQWVFNSNTYSKLSNLRRFYQDRQFLSHKQLNWARSLMKPYEQQIKLTIFTNQEITRAETTD